MSMQMQYEYALPIGYRLQGGENVYVIEEVLGKGGFGVTYKVKTTVQLNKLSFDVHCAVKEYFPDICSREADNATIKIPETKHDEIVNGIKDFLNEGRKLQQVCDLNPHIVNVNEVFEANGTAYYVLEYLEGGDLRKMVKNNGGKGLTEQQMLDVMVPIGHAVQCLHDNNILHLDIKPDNIVMRRNSNGSMEPVLIDFGIAVHFNQKGKPTSKTPSQGISPGYSPIEQYQVVKTFDPRIDVYAYCATCLYLLTGDDPMESMSLMQRPTNCVRSTIPATVSDKVATAIIHGMSIVAQSRPQSMNAVLAMLTGNETIKVEPKPSSKLPQSKTVNLNTKAEKPASKAEATAKLASASSESSHKKTPGKEDNTKYKQSSYRERIDATKDSSLLRRTLIWFAVFLTLSLLVAIIVSKCDRGVIKPTGDVEKDAMALTEYLYKVDMGDAKALKEAEIVIEEFEKYYYGEGKEKQKEFAEFIQRDDRVRTAIESVRKALAEELSRQKND